MNPATISGPTADRSMTPAMKGARILSFVSIGLGAVELIAPGRLARALGMEGREGLLRAYGAREIATGIGVRSVNPVPAMWARVAGDVLDLGTLAMNMPPRHDRGEPTARIGRAAPTPRHDPTDDDMRRTAVARPGDVSFQSDVSARGDVSFQSDVPGRSDVGFPSDAPNRGDTSSFRADQPATGDLPVRTDLPVQTDLPDAQRRDAQPGLPVPRAMPVERPVREKGAASGTRRNMWIAIAAVGGITALDILVASKLAAETKEGKGARRDYSDRSGFPGGVEAARGAAKAGNTMTDKPGSEGTVRTVSTESPAPATDAQPTRREGTETRAAEHGHDRPHDQPSATTMATSERPADTGRPADTSSGAIMPQAKHVDTKPSAKTMPPAERVDNQPIAAATPSTATPSTESVIDKPFASADPVVESLVDNPSASATTEVEDLVNKPFDDPKPVSPTSH